MTKATIYTFLDTTTNTEAMNELNNNFDSINDLLPSNVDGAIVSVAWTQTLTNKTLTSPTINSPTVVTPTITTPTVTNGTFTSPTLVTPVLGTPTSGNLANCTFPTLNQNTTWSANSLKSATGVVDTSAATAPTSGQALVATSATTATWQGNWYWDFAIKLASDFTVTNSSTLTDVTWFSLATVSWERWLIEIYWSSVASDTTGDIKADIITTWTVQASWSFYKWTWYDSVANLTWSSWTAIFSTTSILGSQVINNGDTSVRSLWIQTQVVVTWSGNIKFQIANNSAAAGRTSTIKAGTYMLARKLS